MYPKPCVPNVNHGADNFSTGNAAQHILIREIQFCFVLLFFFKKMIISTVDDVTFKRYVNH